MPGCQHGTELPVNSVLPAVAAPTTVDPALARELAGYDLLVPYLRETLTREAVSVVKLDEQEREQAQQLFLRQHRLADAAALEAFRVARLLSAAALAERIERPLRLKRHCERRFRLKAEARFLQRKTQLDRVVYSLLRLRDGGLARELFLRIDEGEADFAELATQYAEGPEQATRGVVGPVPLTQAHPRLAERLRTARAGQLLEPFLIKPWWLVVRLESFTPASFDAETAERMAHELFEEWLNERVDLAMRALHQQAAGESGP